jgi:hypothetical protein
MADAATYDVKINVNNKQVKPGFDPLLRAVDAIGKNTGLKTLAEGAASAQKGVLALGSSISDLLVPIGAVAGAGAAFDWLKNAATGAMDFGNNLYIASQQTGVAADALAKFHYLGKSVNVDVGAMDKALYRLNLTVQKAFVGKDKNAAAMFRALHIPLKDAHGHMRGLTDIFADLAGAVQKHPAIAQLIAGTGFGTRGAQSMIPVLMMGRDEINKMGADFEAAYGKITPASLEAARKSHEAWEKLDLDFEGLKYRLGNDLLPALTLAVDGLDNLLALIEKLPQWASIEFKVNTPDIDNAAKSFLGVGDAMEQVWEATGPLRDSIGDLLNAMDPSIPDQFDQAIAKLPKPMRDAMPAVRDFMSMFRGDVGASLHNLTRIMNLLAASLREVGLMSKWASSWLDVLKGKSIDLSPPTAAQFSAAWKGEKIPASPPLPPPDKITYPAWPALPAPPRADKITYPAWLERLLGHSGSKSLPIGIRLNNPTNLRSWGSMPTVETASGQFAQFPTIEAGISGAAGNLLAYQLHGWTTLADIISHWAPSSENNTMAYIGDVAARGRFQASQHLNLGDPAIAARLLSAMIHHETGMDLPEAIIAAGVADRLGIHVASPYTLARAPVLPSGERMQQARLPAVLHHTAAESRSNDKITYWDWNWFRELPFFHEVAEAGKPDGKSNLFSKSFAVAGSHDRQPSPKNGKVDVSITVKAPPGVETKVLSHTRGDSVGKVDTGRSFDYA